MRATLLIICAFAIAPALRLPSALASDVIPSNRLASRTVGASDGYGVPGGIYQYRSRTVVNATGLTDTTGGTDYSDTLRAQLQALTAGQVLLVPPGRFRLNKDIQIGVLTSNGLANGIYAHQDNVTLRGSGVGVTTFVIYGGGIGASGGGAGNFYSPGVYVAADVAAGATTATLTSAGEPVPGLNFFFQGYHDPSVPIVSTGGYSNLRPAYLKCLDVTGSTVTFWPPLPFAVKAGAEIIREVGSNSPYYICHATGLGLEDFSVDAANSTATPVVGIYHADNSWMYNVEVYNVSNFGLGMGNCIQSSIIHCIARDHKPGGSSNTRNLIVPVASTLLLIEDNLVYNGFSAFELNAGVMMSAFSHNFTDRISVGATNSSAFNINHGPHNSFNIYEGNITSRIQSDGYFGSSSDETFHRNWFHGTNGVYTTAWSDHALTVDGGLFPVTLNRFCRNFNIVGNQIGRTGTGITWIYTNVGPGFDTTSTTSNTVGSGSRNFTFGTGLRYNNNGTLAFAYSASAPTKWMMGRIWDYNPSDGTCYMNVTRYNGSGTVNDWVIIGGGGYGDPTIYALGGPNIGGGGFFGDFTMALPQSRGIWWRVWDGSTTRMVRNPYTNGSAPYNSGTTYTAGDVVNFYDYGPATTTGGNAVDTWMAANAAKNGTTTWGSPGEFATDWVPIGPNSFQELDRDVYETAIIKDNWNAATNGIHSSEALGGGETYPVSRIRNGSTRPNFFGTSLTYPAFDSHAPNQSFEAIPAGYRYLNSGANVPGYSMDDGTGGAATSGQATVTGRTTVTGTLRLP